jgi:FRG domain
VPSAFRCGTILGYENPEYARVAGETPQDTWDQGNAAFLALVEFLKLAGEVGLNVPADHQWLRQWNPFNNVVGHSIGSSEWPPNDLYEALAIAQHHGVPTRLLDFSYDPIIAAYFAAQGSPSGAKEISVWCIDLQMILLAAKDLHCQLEVVSVPRFRSKNLAAQRALFLLDRGVILGRYTAFENSIANHIERGVRMGRLPLGVAGYGNSAGRHRSAECY